MSPPYCHGDRNESNIYKDLNTNSRDWLLVCQLVIKKIEFIAAIILNYETLLSVFQTT